MIADGDHRWRHDAPQNSAGSVGYTDWSARSLTGHRPLLGLTRRCTSLRIMIQIAPGPQLVPRCLLYQTCEHLQMRRHRVAIEQLRANLVRSARLGRSRGCNALCVTGTIRGRAARA
jgi:hypothetical protein